MTTTGSVKTDSSVVKIEKALFAWPYARANKCWLKNLIILLLQASSFAVSTARHRNPCCHGVEIASKTQQKKKKQVPSHT